jgi:hypothetical protein
MTPERDVDIPASWRQVIGEKESIESIICDLPSVPRRGLTASRHLHQIVVT